MEFRINGFLSKGDQPSTEHGIKGDWQCPECVNPDLLFMLFCNETSKCYDRFINGVVYREYLRDRDCLRYHP